MADYFVLCRVTMIRRRYFSLLLIFALSACVSPTQRAELTQQAEQQRASAWATYEQGNIPLALEKLLQARQLAWRLDASAEVVVRTYDEAGLYHYLQKDYAQSAHNQAIAVLLARSNPALGKMQPHYIERLGWAWARYRPHSDFAPIRSNPLLLLDDVELNLVSDERIRQQFYRRALGLWKSRPAPWVRKTADTSLAAE